MQRVKIKAAQQNSEVAQTLVARYTASEPEMTRRCTALGRLICLEVLRMEPGDHLAPVFLSIRFLSGPLNGQTFLVEKPILTIGRDLANDIVIKADRQVSRQHARLVWTGEEWRIENLSHGNTVRVNDQEIQRETLESGAVVSLGEFTSFTVLPVESADGHAAEAASQPATAGKTSPADRKQASHITAPPTRIAPEATTSERVSRVDATQLASLDEVGLPSLEVTSNTKDGKQTYPLTGAVTSIGRDAANDIVINDRIVSSHHLQIVREGDTFTLIHPHPDRPKTLNGLLYQGRKIRGDERFTKTLARGDLFRIGDEDGTLVTLTFHDGTDSAQSTPPAIEPIKLGAEELTIGRKQDNTIVLAHPQVSAHHAKLTREGAAYRIADLNSTNHVYVNGEIITSHALKTGDEIRIGPYRLVYEGNQLKPYDESSFIRIDAMGLEKQGSNGVTLLDDITLSIPPRSFVALVGGSGAGKSTLLDALNGLRPAQRGNVLFNGQDYYKNMAAYSTQIGYVPQDDIVHRDLTVERALYYAAKIRLPSDFTEEQIEQRINEVLEEVELTHRRSLMVRDLSGGQRKRVSIALELLANPSVFFLDEPTSGLDPGLDRKMMFLLRKLADRGHTILLVTHATNNINSCDYVCFLSAGGRLAYFGPPEEAKAYFGKTDFAEIYTSLEPTEEAPAVPAEAQSRFRASPEYTRYIAAPLREAQNAATKRDTATEPAQRRATAKHGHGWSQFWLLSMRYLELLKNDSVNLMILLLQAPIIALMLVLMLRFEVGAGIFNANSLTQCRTQIVTTTGQLALPEAQHAILTDCQNALNFLKETPCWPGVCAGARRDEPGAAGLHHSRARRGRAESAVHHGVRDDPVRLHQRRARIRQRGANLPSRARGQSRHFALYVLQDSRARLALSVPERRVRLRGTAWRAAPARDIHLSNIGGVYHAHADVLRGADDRAGDLSGRAEYGPRHQLRPHHPAATGHLLRRDHTAQGLVDADCGGDLSFALGDGRARVYRRPARGDRRRRPSVRLRLYVPRHALLDLFAGRRAAPSHGLMDRAGCHHRHLDDRDRHLLEAKRRAGVTGETRQATVKPERKRAYDVLLAVARRRYHGIAGRRNDRAR